MTSYYCHACGLMLSSRAEAEYHYGDCAAFVEQKREESRETRALSESWEHDQLEQSSQDERP